MIIAEQMNEIMNEILRLSKLQDKKDAKTASEIAALKKEISRYSDRDGNAHIELIYPDDNPFNKIDLRICDFGVADNIYVCESDEVMALKEKVKALEAANAKYKSALGHIGSDKEYGECDLDYDGKVCNCKGCEDTRIAREALRED